MSKQSNRARIQEALGAGAGAGGSSHKSKDKETPADGVLTVTPDTPEAVEWGSRKSPLDPPGTTSRFLDDEPGEQNENVHSFKFLHSFCFVSSHYLCELI